MNAPLPPPCIPKSFQGRVTEVEHSEEARYRGAVLRAKKGKGKQECLQAEENVESELRVARALRARCVATSCSREKESKKGLIWKAVSNETFEAGKHLSMRRP